MSFWRASQARKVLAALNRIGWVQYKQVGSHRRLQRSGWKNFTFSFQDGDELGPAAFANYRQRNGPKARRHLDAPAIILDSLLDRRILFADTHQLQS
jgi:predicted RNA binding protein YcfA (HicA-like mRNA interferase family)